MEWQLGLLYWRLKLKLKGDTNDTNIYIELYKGAAWPASAAGLLWVWLYVVRILG
jgi:hypothetical protein